jgi:CBS domain-containing protein
MSNEVKKNLDVSVTELHISDPKYLIDTSSLKEAIDLMNQFNIGSVVVMSEQIELKGIMTERDILKKVAGKDIDYNSSIYQFMTPHPKTLTQGNTVLEALEMMQVGGFRHIPIVNGDGRPIGIISIKDIMTFIYERSIGD